MYIIMMRREGSKHPLNNKVYATLDKAQEAIVEFLRPHTFTNLTNEKYHRTVKIGGHTIWFCIYEVEICT